MLPKEKQIIHLLAKGYNAKEISKLTTLSVSSIENYKKNILQQFNTKNMDQIFQNNNIIIEQFD